MKKYKHTKIGSCDITYDTRRVFFPFCSNIGDIVREFIGHKLYVYVSTSDYEFSKKFIYLIKLGFTNPYITNENPFGEKINQGIIMKYGKKFNPKEALKLAHYTLTQYKKYDKICSVRVRFDNNAILYLKQSSKSGHTENGDHSITQKELGGKLHVIKISGTKDNPVFVIGIDGNSVKNGEEEGISLKVSRYNFHSHPEAAYIKHGVTKAWPSADDFVGYLKLGNRTIFHCVASMEGLYILSFSSEWVNKIKEIDENFVKNNFDIDRRTKETPYDFVKKIREIKYKGSPIFIVKYLNWDQAGSIFSVVYAKEKGFCNPL